MSASTHQVATVTSAAIANSLTEQLLQPRRVYLKHRAPRSKYVHDLRRKMAAFLVRPFEMIVAVLFADIDEGIPVALVTKPLYSLIALCEERAREREIAHGGAVLSLETLHRRETRAEATLNEAQVHALAHPQSPDALQAVIDAEAQYEPIGRALADGARHELARLTLGTASR